MEFFKLNEYLTEQEQIEILKKWLKQYSVVIISGIVVAILLVTGWRFWQQREMKNLSHASLIYDEMLSMRAQNNSSATLAQAQKILSHHPRTIYGQMSAFMIARDATVKGDFKTAKEKLNWVISNCKVQALCQVSRLRLARIYLAENNPSETLKLLATVDDKTFNGLIAELNGDAYLALQNHDQARAHYLQALKELPNADVARPLLQMKFDNLAV